MAWARDQNVLYALTALATRAIGRLHGSKGAQVSCEGYHCSVHLYEVQLVVKFRVQKGNVLFFQPPPGDGFVSRSFSAARILRAQQPPLILFAVRQKSLPPFTSLHRDLLHPFRQAGMFWVVIWENHWLRAALLVDETITLFGLLS